MAGFNELGMNLRNLSRISIRQIASLIGYDDQLYFIRLFKKHKGINPMEYRRNWMSLEYNS